MTKKIKLDLFKLKKKKDLKEIYKFFKFKTRKWFDINLKPKKEFFILKKCLFCKSSTSREVFAIDGFSYHKCKSCESIYTKPHMRDDLLNSLYKDGTYQTYQNKLVKKGKKIRESTLENRKFTQINKLLKIKKPSILDVGCGGGTFLNICKQKGWIVEGLDPSPQSSKEVMKNYEIKVHLGDFNRIKIKKKYDVISFWGVLEHMLDPISALKKAKKHLNKNGIIAFEVPSSDCFMSRYLQKYNFSPTRYIESARHNIFFSRKLIDKLSSENKLQLELIETNGLDIQTILLKEFDDLITEKIINIQDILNDVLLGDHYRVFLKKK